MAGAECEVCGRLKPQTPCALCVSLNRKPLRDEWDYEIPQLLHDEVAAFLGGPHRNAKQRWNLIQSKYEQSEEVNWAKMAEDTDPVIEAPTTDAELRRIAADIEQGVKISAEGRIVLHRGFLMHDGLHFSFQDDRISMNGRRLPHSVPTVSILRILASKQARKGWNLSKLMILLGCTIHSSNGDETLRPPRAGGGRGDRLRYRRLMRRIQQPNHAAVQNVLSWVGWMAEEHLPPPEHYIIHPLAAWARDIKHRLSTRSDFHVHITEAFLNHPDGLDQLDSYPWLKRWNSYRGTRQQNAPYKWPLKVVGGKLKMRVRTKRGTTMYTNVPDDPKTWALLLSMSLSPLTSHVGETLFSIQRNWTSVEDSTTKISAPLQRSIILLNDIIDGAKGRVFVHDKYILVVGRLGHFYEVQIGPGAHGAPFMIRLVDSLKPRRTTSICIHSGTFHSHVPLGDTLATVVLTLLDDVGASKEVDSLLNQIAHHSPLGFPGLLDKDHLALLDSQSVEQIQAILKRGRLGMVAPYWMEAFRDQIQRGRPNARGRGENAYFQYMERRNRRRMNYDFDYVPVDGHIGEATILVSHALAAKRPVPIEAMAKLWQDSLSEIDQQEPERPRRGGVNELFNRRFDFADYIQPRQRNDWMFIRNQGQAEQDAPIGDIRNGERRYCEVFPRVWEAMLQQPIGSTLKIATRDGGDLSFQHCMLRVTLRAGAERRLVRQFAREAGYVENGREGAALLFRRRDHPRQWARRNLSEHLTRIQEGFGFRGAPPWWWHFMEAQQAPDEVPAFRWELEADLRDDNGNQRAMGGDYQP